MKSISIVLFADFNSAFARDWAMLIKDSHFNCTLVSSRTLAPDIDLDCVQPSNNVAALKRLIASRNKVNTTKSKVHDHESASISLEREFFAFFNTLMAAYYLRREVKRTNPDLVHAMRSTFEGVAANISLPGKENIAVSIWGNDFTLHCEASRISRYLVNKLLSRIKGIHADANDDLVTATNDFKLNHKVIRLHVPTSGGVPTEQLRLDVTKVEAKRMLGLPEDCTLIVNPRGTRSYIDQDVFFKAAAIDSCSSNIYLAVNVQKQSGWSHLDALDQADWQE